MLLDSKKHPSLFVWNDGFGNSVMRLDCAWSESLVPISRLGSLNYAPVASLILIVNASRSKFVVDHELFMMLLRIRLYFLSFSNLRTSSEVITRVLFTVFGPEPPDTSRWVFFSAITSLFASTTALKRLE